MSAPTKVWDLGFASLHLASSVTENGTQVLINAQHVLYRLSYISNPPSLMYFDIQIST